MPPDKVQPIVNRFHFTPGYQNTFVNFMPPKTAGSYCAPKNQFLRKTIEPVNVGVEEKEKRQLRNEAKRNLRAQREAEFY